MTDPCYAIFVRNEAKASDDLADAGFECWSFTYKRFRAGASWALRNVNGRTRVASRPAAQVDSPLIPGYVFARIAPGRFAEALETPRVVDVVRGTGGIPRAVPDDLIGDLILEMMSGRHDETAIPPPKKINLEGYKAPIIPKARARSRKRRKGATARIKKWIAEGDPQHLAKAA